MFPSAITFPSSDGKTTIHGTVWAPEGQPRGILQVMHGVTEHMGRYQDFAAYFTGLGYVVCGISAAGHGESLYDGRMRGHFDRWAHVVADNLTMSAQMKAQYSSPALPFYMIGFSMGSFVLRTIILEAGEQKPADGYFLLGTGTQPVFLLRMIHRMMQKECTACGPEACTDRVQAFAFANYNQKIKNPESRADWLLADRAERDKYLSDPLVPEKISAGLFGEMLSGMIFCCDRKNRADVREPVYLLSGQEDPVGDFGKGITKTEALLKKQGFSQVSSVLFPHMRHDILHESGHEDVYETIRKALETEQSGTGGH